MKQFVRRWQGALLLLLLTAPISCQTAPAAAPLREGKTALFPGALVPGEPYVVAVSGYRTAPLRASLFRGDTRLGRGRFFDLGESGARGKIYCAIMAVPSTAAGGPARLLVEGDGAVLA
ncbi:MAG: hypothetical protein LBN92_02590, partial [Treponema sp.]|nr:hypothetical protein [Treponema sp.]